MKLDDAPLLSARIDVRAYHPDDQARWSDFVAHCADATFFHRIEWKAILEEVFGHRTHYMMAERNGELIGVLPLAEVRSFLFGHALVSLPFAVYGGVAATDDVAVKELHAAAVRTAQAIGVDHLELRNRTVREVDWPRQDLYVTFRKEIAPDVDANLLAIPRKQRAMVRKAMQRGLTAEIDPSIERFFRLYADNQQRHGTPAMPKRYFERLKRDFGNDCEVQIVRAPQGEAVSGVLSFYWRDEILPYYAGDLPAARDLAANDFKYWELMRRVCQRGTRVFDYGRSKRDSGSFSFKKNWGFEPAALAYEYKLLRGDRIPQNNPANPKYRAFIALWRRLPRGVANALGPVIVRGLG